MWGRIEMENIYHVCTDGMSRNLLFRNDKEFIQGMNAAALCTLSYKVKILCFCLMSNHVHFIIKGTHDNCLCYIRLYKKRINTGKGIANADVAIKLIDTEEYLKTAIAYVLRNPIAARLQIMPNKYRWSSGNLYFADNDNRHQHLISVADLTYNEKRTLLNTRIVLPDNYLITEYWMILPSCYVDYKAVENLYRTPAAFLYYLSKNPDIESELTSDILRKAKYSDQELYNSMISLCASLYKTESLALLTIEQKLKLAKALHKKYGAGAKQIARLVGIDILLLKELI